MVQHLEANRGFIRQCQVPAVPCDNVRLKNKSPSTISRPEKNSTPVNYPTQVQVWLLLAHLDVGEFTLLLAVLASRTIRIAVAKSGSSAEEHCCNSEEGHRGAHCGCWIGVNMYEPVEEKKLILTCCWRTISRPKFLFRGDGVVLILCEAHLRIKYSGYIKYFRSRLLYLVNRNANKLRAREGSSTDSRRKDSIDRHVVKSQVTPLTIAA